MEKTAVQYARALVVSSIITSLHEKNIGLILNYFTKMPNRFFECYNLSKEICIAHLGKAARYTLPTAGHAKDTAAFYSRGLSE